MPTPEQLIKRKWRVGSKIGRTIYAIVPGRAPWQTDHDTLIGMMDTPALAKESVRAHNVGIPSHMNPVKR